MSGERGPGGDGRGLAIGGLALVVLVLAAAVWAPVAGLPGLSSGG